MSLDIYLTNKKCKKCGYSKPIEFDFNITHNLGKMASKCGLYYAMWRPEELGIKQTKYIIPLLKEGIENLKEHKEFYLQFKPENGWGNYDNLLEQAENYLRVCLENPEAEIEINR